MTLRSLIPCLPEPNHLRLIKEAYPRSKSATEPDSNALGKLTFYTKSRPVKLAKVGRALLQRCQKYSESDQRICITLVIIKKLLDECRNDVFVFSNEAMGIIEVGLQRASRSRNSAAAAPLALELYEKTAGAFYALVTFSTAGAIDDSKYINLLKQFCTLAKDNKMQIRIVGLQALDGVVTSDLFYSAEFRSQADTVVATLLQVLVEGGLDQTLLDQMSPLTKETSRIPGAPASSSSPYTPSRPPLNDRRARSIRAAKGLDGTEKPLTAQDTAEASLKTLQTLFRLSQPRHIESTLFSFVHFFDHYNPDGSKQSIWTADHWCKTFSGKTMEWTQAQYRFAIISFWLEQLEALQLGAYQSDLSSPTASSSLGAIKGNTITLILIHLLSSPTASVVNLALSDVLSSLSTLLVRTPHDQLLKDAINALSSHIYYPEQINDLVGDLLADVIKLEEQSGHEDSSRSDAIIAILDCITRMVQTTHQNHTARASSKGKSPLSADLNLPPEQLEASLVLLDDSDTTVRAAYLSTIRQILLCSTSSAAASNNVVEQEGVPSITVASASSTGLPLDAAESTRYARELQMRLYSLLQSNKNISTEEETAILELLKIVYGTSNAKVVVEGLPVLLGCETVTRAHATKERFAESMTSQVMTTLSDIWSLLATSAKHTPATIIESLASSSSLQKASGLSASELATKLSQPFSHSPTTANSTLGLAYSPKKTYSIRTNPGNRDSALSRSLNSRPGSLYTTSLADLKQSLGSPQSANTASGLHNGFTYTTRTNSPNTSHSAVQTNNNSVASSIIENGHNGAATPPSSKTSPVASHSGPVPHSHGHTTSAIPLYLLHEKEQSSAANSHQVNGSPTKSPSPTKSFSQGGRSRLERIIGSVDDQASPEPKSGQPPQRSISIQPPYQLS